MDAMKRQPNTEHSSSNSNRASMAAIGIAAIQEFCKLCNWAYEAWATHRVLFNDNTEADNLKASHYGEPLGRLSIITQEYALLQISKLHDPAVQRDRINLSLEYVIKFGGWDKDTVTKLYKLYHDLEALAKKLRGVRNKILSHNDLAAILDASCLGEFEQGADIQYFESLQEFVNVVHEKTIGGIFPFNDLARGDAEILLTALIDAIEDREPE
jgi:hypothetical protein